MMSKILQGIDPDAGILCYIDNLIVFNATWEEHFKSLQRLFNALLEAGVILKLSKIYSGPKHVTYLGHVLSADGISIGNDVRMPMLRSLSRNQSRSPIFSGHVQFRS